MKQFPKITWRGLGGNAIVFVCGALAATWFGWQGVVAVGVVVCLISYLSGFYEAWKKDRDGSGT